MDKRWRIKECSHGYFAEYGWDIGGLGIMPAFYTQERHFFRTKRGAEGYIKRRCK